MWQMIVKDCYSSIGKRVTLYMYVLIVFHKYRVYFSLITKSKMFDNHCIYVVWSLTDSIILVK